MNDMTAREEIGYRPPRRLRGVRVLGWALSVSLIASALACYEVDTTITIDGNNPPAFGTSGSGTINFLWVTEIAPENQRLVHNERDSDQDVMLWQIWPSTLTDSRVRKLPPIKYGSVPHGFTQKIPERGQPPPLVERKIYAVGVPSSNANFTPTWFTVRGGKTVEVPIPGGF